MSQIITNKETNLDKIQVGPIKEDSKPIIEIESDVKASKSEWTNFEKIIFRIAFIFFGRMRMII